MWNQYIQTVYYELTRRIFVRFIFKISIKVLLIQNNYFMHNVILFLL
jgi:hypothetical protein